jgi:hypothetical protein
VQVSLLGIAELALRLLFLTIETASIYGTGPGTTIVSSEVHYICSISIDPAVSTEPRLIEWLQSASVARGCRTTKSFETLVESELGPRCYVDGPTHPTHLSAR